MKGLLFKNFKIIILIISASCLISGQTVTGVINGTVLDSLLGMVPGANITLTLKEAGQTKVVHKTTTDNEGKYSFSNVPIGTYEISVRPIGLNKDFRKLVNVTSAKPVQTNFTISFEPCSDEEESINTIKLTDIDRAEIVRELFKLSFGTAEHKTNTNTNNDKIIFSNDNFNLDWLTTDQKTRIIVETRQQIQDRTEKKGELRYFTVSKMTQRGRCVGVSMLENLTIKGQLEDANMAGGGTVYEFRKVDGHWIGTMITAWIS